ncbi:class A sortase [Lentilactobacillus sp. SPB1-3]|uniref:Class A sortase n=1 Tax=Lentilactobacillus terminaliae TaxID=3003483 RepID=A0ACD5DGH9_9LACO|nr:class A sortase [Lentilactobacillus sp. SPB1-3]MCZ0977923.1 class A sortase [Lentilactobacillus sp. SPB1-3]
MSIGLGVSNQSLALAAGTMRPDQKMGSGNYPLAGHHMLDHNILFGPLYYRAKVGQMVYLTDMNYVYKYVIYQKKFISAYNISVIKQTKKPIVTLITCDKTGANRLMVRGKYQGRELIKDTYSNLRQSITKPKFN